MPPLSALRPASVCELLPLNRKHHERLAADPELELYDFSVVPPRPVPLNIRLHVENLDKLRKVMRISQRVYQDVFRHHSVPDQRILTITDSSHYEAFRDFCQLQGTTRLDHTLVVQVDEFWGRIDPTPFAPLNDYLSRKFNNEPGEDPFGVFRDLPDRVSAFQNQKECFLEGYQLPKLERKLDGEVEADEGTLAVDKLPYTWDFGFLLCDQEMWEIAADVSFQVGSKPKKVREVQVTNPGDMRAVPRRVTWREFLGACVAVAEHRTDRPEPYAAFDVDPHVPGESLSSLFLEVWLSEIKVSARLKRLGKRNPTKLFDTVSQRSFDHNQNAECSLSTLVDVYRPEFFRTWLLLGDFIASNRFPSENLLFTRPTQSDRPRAVATRHWYSTASIVYRQGENQPSQQVAGEFVPSRLPGWFSVRGDWDLAILRGSLSTRLGERALDLLSSRRSQIERLRNGLGLPTRDVTALKTRGGAWTCLWRRVNGLPKRVHYYELQRLGVTFKDREKMSGNASLPDEEFKWLWRSSLQDYARVSRLWVVWLCSMRESWQAIRREAFPKATSGLTAYDLFLADKVSVPDDFVKRLNYLSQSIRQASGQTKSS